MQDPLEHPAAKNICFSVPTSVNREQFSKFEAQRRERGFDDSETWNLDMTIAKFILPRLIVFRQLNNGMPQEHTEESYNAVLDEIIEGLTYKANEDEYDLSPEEELVHFNKITKAFELLSKHIHGLWW